MGGARTGEHFLPQLLLHQPSSEWCRKEWGPLSRLGFYTGQGGVPQVLFAAVMGTPARRRCPEWFSPSDPRLLRWREWGCPQ